MDALEEPFLYDIFGQTPQQDNFFGISPSRTDDLEGSAEASFTINEVDGTYSDVVIAPVLPLFPATGRWSILLDGFLWTMCQSHCPLPTFPMLPQEKLSW
jgi:hypothetical protein